MRGCWPIRDRTLRRREIAAIADADARENWQVMIAFRDHLARHRTLEAAYLDIVRRNLKFPHIFLNQIVHVILRNVLDGCDDAFVLRAAELFFRPQKLTLHDGSLVAADEETLSGLGNKPVSPLVSMLGLPPAAEIDVLNDDNAADYWERSDLFDMALDLTAGRRGLTALGRGHRALDRPSSAGRGQRRAAGRTAGCHASPGTWASTRTPPASVMRCGTVRSLRTQRATASSASIASRSPTPQRWRRRSEVSRSI